jgi:hypothetical protein
MYQPAKVYKIKHLHKIEVAQNDPSGCTFVLVCQFPVLQNKYQKINGSREFFFLDRALCPFSLRGSLGGTLQCGAAVVARSHHEKTTGALATGFTQVLLHRRQILRPNRAHRGQRLEPSLYPRSWIPGDVPWKVLLFLSFQRVQEMRSSSVSKGGLASESSRRHSRSHQSSSSTLELTRAG